MPCQREQMLCSLLPGENIAMHCQIFQISGEAGIWILIWHLQLPQMLATYSDLFSTNSNSTMWNKDHLEGRIGSKQLQFSYETIEAQHL